MTEIVKYAMWALLVLAAAQDMWQLKISNKFFIGLVALFPIWVYAVGFETDIWQNIVVFLIALLLGSLAYRGGMLGGGDVKLFAAAALWFDLMTAPRFLMSIVLSGAVLALALIIVRRFLPRVPDGAPGWAVLRRKGPIPYGMAIAAGAIMCAHLFGFNPAPKLNLPTLDFDALTASASR